MTHGRFAFSNRDINRVFQPIAARRFEKHILDLQQETPAIEVVKGMLCLWKNLGIYTTLTVLDSVGKRVNR
jgi:hypothetical protein